MVDRAFVDRPYPRIIRSLNRACSSNVRLDPYSTAVVELRARRRACTGRLGEPRSSASRAAAGEGAGDLGGVLENDELTDDGGVHGSGSSSGSV